MTFWIVAGAVGVVLLAIAWWTSGRARGHVVDGRRAMITSDAYSRSNETQARLDGSGQGSSW